MLRKFFSFTILLSALIFSTAAAHCPTYLDADKNYILYADLGGQGAGLYVDRSTVKVEEELPVGYIILIDTVEVPDAAEGKTQVVNRRTRRYLFDFREENAYRYAHEEDKWIKLDPTITNVEDENFTYDARIAEMALYLRFGDKFFGTFDETFYDALR